MVRMSGRMQVNREPYARHLTMTSLVIPKFSTSPPQRKRHLCRTRKEFRLDSHGSFRKLPSLP
jgi:hypothetical protein